MRIPRAAFVIGLLTALGRVGFCGEPAPAGFPSLKTKNVILVTTDGLRWQEVFEGADRSLMTKKEGKVDDVPGLTKKYWRENRDERRAALMPFLWSEIAKRGQLYGNAALIAEAKVTNGKNFSYPGYNEILSGKADSRIDSNDKVPNPNITVLEWLEQKPEFRGKVAAFGSWDVFPWILNRDRSKLPVNAGFDPLEVPNMHAGVALLNRFQKETPRMWGGERYDSLTHPMGLEYLKQKKPRVFFMGYGDTDEFAHEGRYDAYLDAARRVDDYLREIWEFVQSTPEYRDTTTLIVSTDHGRGDSGTGEWTSHGAKISGAERIWIGVLGPDTPALGERKDQPTTTQSQIAATLAALLGENFSAAIPGTGAPINAVIGRK